jgi:hypothetical protein
MDRSRRPVSRISAFVPSDEPEIDRPGRKNKYLQNIDERTKEFKQLSLDPKPRRKTVSHVLTDAEYAAFQDPDAVFDEQGKPYSTRPAKKIRRLGKSLEVTAEQLASKLTESKHAMVDPDTGEPVTTYGFGGKNIPDFYQHIITGPLGLCGFSDRRPLSSYTLTNFHELVDRFHRTPSILELRGMRLSMLTVIPSDVALAMASIDLKSEEEMDNLAQDCVFVHDPTVRDLHAAGCVKSSEILHKLRLGITPTNDFKHATELYSVSGKCVDVKDLGACLHPEVFVKDERHLLAVATQLWPEKASQNA